MDVGQKFIFRFSGVPFGIYLLKVTIETLEQSINFTTYLIPCSSISVVNFEQEIACWDGYRTNEIHTIMRNYQNQCCFM